MLVNFPNNWLDVVVKMFDLLCVNTLNMSADAKKNELLGSNLLLQRILILEFLM